MPRESKRPLTFEDLLSVDISFLKSSGILEDFGNKHEVTWKVEGHVIEVVHVTTLENNSSLKVKFDFPTNPRLGNSFVEISDLDSNLGIGRVPFFICPKSNRRCRRIYFYKGEMVGRHAIPAFYSSQLKTKEFREIEKIFGPQFELDGLYEEIFTDSVRKYYAGKLTRKYQAKIDRINRLETYLGIDNMEVGNE